MSAPNQLQQNSVIRSVGAQQVQGINYFDQYYQTDVTMTIDGGIDTPLVLTLKYHKAGNMVTVDYSFAGAATADAVGLRYISAANSIPTAYFPLADQNIIVSANVSTTTNSYARLWLRIADGTLNLWSSGATFPIGMVFSAGTFTYFI